MSFAEWQDLTLLLAYIMVLLCFKGSRLAPLILAFCASSFIAASPAYEALNLWQIHLSYLIPYLIVWRYLQSKTLVICCAVMVMFQFTCAVDDAIYLYQNAISEMLIVGFTWESSFLYERYAAINAFIHLVILYNGVNWRRDVIPRLQRFSLRRAFWGLVERRVSPLAFS